MSKSVDQNGAAIFVGRCSGPDCDRLVRQRIPQDTDVNGMEIVRIRCCECGHTAYCRPKGVTKHD
jgi:hypothetical protein